MQSLKKNWLIVSLSNLRNLVNFHPNTQKSETFTSMGYFFRKHMRFELKKYSGVIFHDTEQWCKIWINFDLVVSKLAWGIEWSFIKALKNLKICILMGSFCPKCNVAAIMALKGDANVCENWLVAWKMTRNLVNFHASSWKS